MLLSVYKQWGRNNVATTSFSVTFSVLYVMAFGYESWGSATYDNYPWVTRSTTGFNTPTYRSAYLSWWALGVQQWGLANLDAHDAVRTISFPIRYKTTAFSIVAYCYDNQHANEYINNAWTVNWGTSSFVFKHYQYATKYSWFSTGV